MKAMRSIKFALASTLLLSSFSAYAGDANKKIKEKNDWSLWETKISTGEVCYVQSGGENDTYLVLIKAKNNPRSPVEIMVQMLKNKRGATGLVSTTEGLSSTMAFADASGKKAAFQGIPKNLAQMVELMKNSKTKLKVNTVGGSKSEETKISTSGFKEMVAELESRCNAGQRIVDTEFENNFANAVADSLDPLKIDITKSSQIRSIYFAAYPISVDIGGAKIELNQVLSKYQPLIDELNQNRNSANRLQNTDIPTARNQLSQAQQEQAAARAEIARVDAALPGLTAKVQSSQKALDAARATIAPIVPEYNRLTSILSSAQNTLDQSEDRLAYIDNRLRDGAQQINALESEARSIENFLPQKRNDAARARSIYNDAASRRQAYNVNWERDARLRNNFEYGRLVNEQRRFDHEVRRSQMELQNLKRERDRIARELQICMANPMIEQLAPFPGRPGRPGQPPGDGVGPAPGPGGPGRPGFPGRPPGGPGGPGGPGRPPGPGPGPGPRPEPPVQPQPPTPQPPAPGPVTPPRDCSALQAALQNANAQVSQKENEVRQIAQRANDVERRMRDIERQVDFEVRREYDMLVDREEQARREMDRIESSLRQDENRVAQIRHSQIPQLVNEQSSLTNERPGVIANINDARSAVSRYSSELARFKSANDWDRKAANVSAKENQLGSDQSALDSANASKANAEGNLQVALSREAQIKAQIDSLNAQLVALNQRAGQLQASINGLPAERAPIDQRIADLQAQLRARQTQMLELLR